MELGLFLVTLGALFLVGLAADEIGRRLRLPRVTLLLLCGLAVGHAGFDLLPRDAHIWYEFLAVTALTMVAFLLGGSLRGDTLRRNGRAILAVSAGVVLATLAVVTAGLWALGYGLPLALILAAIATATAPAATTDVIRQAGAKGRFVETLKGIVAIDDAWGLMAFSLALVAAGALNGDERLGHLAGALWEVGGAAALGMVIGFPAAALSGRIRPGEPLQAEALGIVFLCAGAAMWLEVSFLLAAITAGAVIVNFAAHHTRAFHEIEHIEWPFMALFFILAGATLEVTRLGDFGLLGAAYVVLRVAARVAGGWIGAALAGVDVRERRWYGVAMTPQAGVAVGMALVAADAFPALAETVLTVTIGTTVVFELFGPVATQFALRRTGSIQNRRAPSDTS